MEELKETLDRMESDNSSAIEDLQANLQQKDATIGKLQEAREETEHELKDAIEELQLNLQKKEEEIQLRQSNEGKE